jgi:hypothetical protein
MQSNPNIVLAIAVKNAMNGDSELLTKLVTPNLTELQRSSLINIIKNIKEAHNCSGGDFSYSELLYDEINKNKLNSEEITYVRLKLGI